MLEVRLLAYDSMGVRSMATLVETKDLRLMIDPGAALAPYRYGLPPHPLEVERLNEVWGLIEENLLDCTHVIITHYHYDHHEPEVAHLLVGKTVFVKHPVQNINFSQMRRSKYFLTKISEAGGSYEYADGRMIKVGSTVIRMSEPIPHGVDTKLGYVIMVSVADEDEKLLFTSDVEGPSLESQVNVILREKPDILVVDGPMTYMLGYKYSYESFERALNNLTRIVEEAPLRLMILEHHLMRDLDYKSKLEPLLVRSRQKGVEVMCAAEYEGKPVEMLEARRKELYETYKPEGGVKPFSRRRHRP